MARAESDREDLFAEATAFVRRAELTVRGIGEPIVFGSKRDGAWSIYFGTDPVFHFDPGGRLKRAFAGGRLYRTQGDTLAELTREQTAGETILRRRDLTQPERDQFLAAIRARLAGLLTTIKNGELDIRRSWPADFEPLHDLVARLAAVFDADDAGLLAPRFRGKR